MKKEYSDENFVRCSIFTVLINVLPTINVVLLFKSVKVMEVLNVYYFKYFREWKLQL